MISTEMLPASCPAARSLSHALRRQHRTGAASFCQASFKVWWNFDPFCPCELGIPGWSSIPLAYSQRRRPWLFRWAVRRSASVWASSPMVWMPSLCKTDGRRNVRPCADHSRAAATFSRISSEKVDQFWLFSKSEAIL